MSEVTDSFDLPDVVMPSFFVGLAFGRLGCFLNGCCYGDVCSLPWAVQWHRPGPLGRRALRSGVGELWRRGFPLTGLRPPGDALSREVMRLLGARVALACLPGGGLSADALSFAELDL